MYATWMKAETLKVQIQSPTDATKALKKSNQISKQSLSHLDKEEDSIEGERSKETADEESRFE